MQRDTACAAQLYAAIGNFVAGWAMPMCRKTNARPAAYKRQHHFASGAVSVNDARLTKLRAAGACGDPLRLTGWLPFITARQKTLATATRWMSLPPRGRNSKPCCKKPRPQMRRGVYHSAIKALSAPASAAGCSHDMECPACGMIRTAIP